jgi:AcrR family transcriptional regulator
MQLSDHFAVFAPPGLDAHEESYIILEYIIHIFTEIIKMPRRFTSNQITSIRQKIITAAMQKITQTGVRKTTVEDLTAAAGISTGAFYKFYSSKEALFFEVYEILEQQIKDDFLAIVDRLPSGDRNN